MSAGLATDLPLTSRITSPDLEAVIGGDPVRVDGGDDHAAVGLAGRQREAELRHVAIGNLVLLLLVRRLL
jgi:hypothetical protein